MSQTTTQAQAHVLMVKLRCSSLLLFSTLRSLMISKWTETSRETKILSEDMAREVIKQMRRDPEQQIQFRNSISDIYPSIEAIVFAAVEQYRRLMTPLSKRCPAEHFEVWESLYFFMLQQCYIHPQMLWSDVDNKLYKMNASLDIINDAWESFVIDHVPLMADESTLTEDILREHTRQFESVSEYEDSIAPSVIVPPDRQRIIKNIRI